MMPCDVIEARHVGGCVLWLRFRDGTVAKSTWPRSFTALWPNSNQLPRPRGCASAFKDSKLTLGQIADAAVYVGATSK